MRVAVAVLARFSVAWLGVPCCAGRDRGDDHETFFCFVALRSTGWCRACLAEQFLVLNIGIPKDKSALSPSTLLFSSLHHRYYLLSFFFLVYPRPTWINSLTLLLQNPVLKPLPALTRLLPEAHPHLQPALSPTTLTPSVPNPPRHSLTLFPLITSAPTFLPTRSPIRLLRSVLRPSITHVIRTFLRRLLTLPLLQATHTHTTPMLTPIVSPTPMLNPLQPPPPPPRTLTPTRHPPTRTPPLISSPNPNPNPKNPSAAPNALNKSASTTSPMTRKWRGSKRIGCYALRAINGSGLGQIRRIVVFHGMRIGGVV